MEINLASVSTTPLQTYSLMMAPAGAGLCRSQLAYTEAMRYRATCGTRCWLILLTECDYQQKGVLSSWQVKLALMGLSPGPCWACWAGAMGCRTSPSWCHSGASRDNECTRSRSSCTQLGPFTMSEVSDSLWSNCSLSLNASKLLRMSSPLRRLHPLAPSSSSRCLIY